METTDTAEDLERPDASTPPGAIAGAPPPFQPPVPPASPDDEAPPVAEQPIDGPPDPDEDPLSDPGTDDDIEILEPKINPVPRMLSDIKGREVTYTQTMLTWFTRLELYSLLGRAIDNAMSGDNGVGLNDLLAATQPKTLLDEITSSLPGADDAPDKEDREEQQGMEQAGQILIVFARILSFAPDLLKEAYCVILNIPKAHRNWAINHALDRMEPDTGEDVLHVFIDQNWEAMEDFFVRVLPRLLKRGKQARKRYAEVQSKH